MKAFQGVESNATGASKLQTFSSGTEESIAGGGNCLLHAWNMQKPEHRGLGDKVVAGEPKAVS